jgi:integrative and conjugative element protein (TIGR02256 family)
MRNRSLVPEAVWVPQTVLHRLAAEATALAPLETGGMLLGYVADNEQSVEAVVEEIVGPGPDALHGRYRFLPDGRWQRSQMLKAFYASGGVITYLGDWHSHPNGGSTPSGRDLKTVRAVARRRRARTPNPLSAILYGAERNWRLAPYVYDGEVLSGISLREY